MTKKMPSTISPQTSAIDREGQWFQKEKCRERLLSKLRATKEEEKLKQQLLHYSREADKVPALKRELQRCQTLAMQQQGGDVMRKTAFELWCTGAVLLMRADHPRITAGHSDAKVLSLYLQRVELLMLFQQQQ